MVKATHAAEDRFAAMATVSRVVEKLKDLKLPKAETAHRAQLPVHRRLLRVSGYALAQHLHQQPHGTSHARYPPAHLGGRRLPRWAVHAHELCSKVVYDLK